MERTLRKAKVETMIWATISFIFGFMALIIASSECEDMMAQILGWETALACAIVAGVTGRIGYCQLVRVEFLERVLKGRERADRDKLNTR